MTEQKPPKLDPAIVRDLQSSDEKTLLKTVQLLRSHGNLDYIPLLVRLLCQTPIESVQSEIVRLIADIKKETVVPRIVKHLKDSCLEGNKALIVSACWQSGLDFSEDLDLFIHLFLEGDYLTALESFTVIEQSLPKLAENDIDRLRSQFLQGIDTIIEEKKPLARELAYLLES